MKISKYTKIPISHSIYLIFSGEGAGNIYGFDSKKEANKFLKQERNKNFSIISIYSKPTKFVRDY